MGDKYCIGVALAPLVEKPDMATVIGKGGSQLLFGETFIAEGEEGEWSYGTSESDGYRGFVHSSNLRPPISHTHVVGRPLAHVYPEPDFKTWPVMEIGMMSRIQAGKAKNGFIEVPGYGWVFGEHLSNTIDPDFVQTAMMFENSPYLYSGRSARGIDCSGLVQISLSRAGIPCPRDASDQARIGKDISRSAIGRGDLAFFKGHVGIMLDSTHVLNANSRSMDVRIEKIAELEKIYNGLLAVKRPPAPQAISLYLAPIP